MLQQFSKKNLINREFVFVFFFHFNLALRNKNERPTLPDILTTLNQGGKVVRVFRKARARVRRASSGLSAVVSHWKGPNGGASQGSQDVVMEDGSFHMAATSLNL